MHRFYLFSPDIKKDILTLKDPRLLHQLNRVLRMKSGDRFSIFNDEKGEHSLEILEIDRHQILAQMIEKIDCKTESATEVSLYQAVPKKTALFEWVIQKATELGVSHVYPLITERTENRRLSKFDRLVTIATEATEQSGRLRVPVVHHPIPLEAVLKEVTNGYLAYEMEGKDYLGDYQKTLKSSSVQIIIGPEGGFSNREIVLAEKSKVHLFSLGPRILRTETAAIAALSILFSSLKD